MAETTGCIHMGWTAAAAAAAADGAAGGRIGLGIRHKMAVVDDSSLCKKIRVSVFSRNQINKRTDTVAGDKMAAAGDNPARPNKADNKTSLKLLGGVQQRK